MEFILGEHGRKLVDGRLQADCKTCEQGIFLAKSKKKPWQRRGPEEYSVLCPAIWEREGGELQSNGSSHKLPSWYIFDTVSKDYLGKCSGRFKDLLCKSNRILGILAGQDLAG